MDDLYKMLKAMLFTIDTNQQQMMLHLVDHFKSSIGKWRAKPWWYSFFQDK